MKKSELIEENKKLKKHLEYYMNELDESARAHATLISKANHVQNLVSDVICISGNDSENYLCRSLARIHDILN